MNKVSPIGVFDSGIGGLSVLKQLMRFLPNEKFIYLGDTARVPYGNRTPEIIRQYSKECTKFLIEKGVKLIVVACNTASSVALDAIRSISDVPVIGMIQPAAIAAIRATNNGKIGIIGTRATIASKSYSNGILGLPDSNKVELISVACPLFVPLVEEGWLRHAVTRQVAVEYLSPLIENKTDTIILGCTHYPLLLPLLNELMLGVTFIDSGEHASVASLRQLAELDLLSGESTELLKKPEIKFYVTDVPTQFIDTALRFLGFATEHPEIVDISSI
ncbi:MAG: glutamate racemase [Candidatus Kapabacteria bacterium]|nr:glutamate racemase [Candidatus Kapabacteria bacterium]